jgi:methionyl aminopeptidase
MIISSPQQLKQYKAVAKLSTEILWQLHQRTRAGVTPREIDELADKLCRKNQAQPNFKGVGSPHNPYQFATCISVNDVVVHGIPTDVPLKAGDLVKVDFGLVKDGLNTDHCFTMGIGELSDEDQELLEVGREAVLKAARAASAGKRAGDLGHLMENTAIEHDFSVTEQYVGHGIGTKLHEEPQIPAWGEPGTGTKLEKGMVLCVEAQVIAGSSEVYTANDGWSVKTRDGSKAVMFEYMVLVEKNKPVFLTPTADWPLNVD